MMGRFILLTALLTFAGWLQSGSGESAGVQVTGAPGELSEREAAVHVLNRLGYGPRPGDVERVLAIGVDAYIEAQLRPAGVTENPTLERRLASYAATAMTQAELLDKYPLPQRMRREMRMSGGEIDTAALRRAARASYAPVRELGQARLTRAIYSERQLQEVMVDFWFNHFNVFARKGAVRLLLVEYERDVIRPNALGNFRELLGAVARSPAMLFYLDNWMSAAAEDAPRAGLPPSRTNRGTARGGPGARRARGLNENYARELLELHTLGVDGGYTQDDVVEVARAFTGWTIDLRRGEFVFRPFMHDAGKKVVLGHEIAGGGEVDDGERVLDLVARHPSTARFISYKLAVRFVSDEPPAALVERAAATFTETDGNIREVVRTIVMSPEFLSREAYRAKVKTPLEWTAGSVRGLGVDVENMRRLMGVLQRLDQPLYGYGPPTGYPDVAEAWVSASALLQRAQLSRRIGTAGSQRGRWGGEAGAEADRVDAVLERLLPGVETKRLKRVIESQVEASAPREGGRLATAIALTLASPEFQRK